MQDYSDVLETLNKDLNDRSADVRTAMDVVNELKALIAQIQGLQNNFTASISPSQIISDASPPPII